MTNYIVLAIPVFFALIGIEVVAALISGRDDYRLADSLADLGCGTLQQLLEVFIKTALFAGYLFVYEQRLWSVPDGAWWAWVLCFLGVDFLYYWFHRLSHEVGVFWAAHVVHHQSEEYNLTVALRQGALQGAFSWVFYLPLALIGFSPLMFLTLSSANTLYQFWIHTRAIGRLGPLEGLLNTPSNHRVHHARNPKYIDKNHGGTLIVWDRLFGTYTAEEEEPVYGITTPLATWNPVWANLANWADMLRLARRTTRLGDKLRLLVERPGWRPDELGGYVGAPEVDRASYRKFETPVPGVLAGYALAHFLLALGLSSLLLFKQQELPLHVLLSGALLTVLSLVSLSALFERKRWALPVEGARVALLAALGLLAGHAQGALGAALLLAALLLLAFLLIPLRQRELTVPASA